MSIDVISNFELLVILLNVIMKPYLLIAGKIIQLKCFVFRNCEWDQRLSKLSVSLVAYEKGLFAIGYGIKQINQQ